MLMEHNNDTPRCHCFCNPLKKWYKYIFSIWKSWQKLQDFWIFPQKRTTQHIIPRFLLCFLQTKKDGAWQFFVTFLGWLSDLLERLSDLQLGDQKVTLNHLGGCFLAHPQKKCPSHPVPSHPMSLKVCGKMVPTWWTKVSVAPLPILGLLATTPPGKLRWAKRKICIYIYFRDWLGGLLEKIRGFSRKIWKDLKKNTGRGRVLLGSLFIYILYIFFFGL